MCAYAHCYSGVLDVHGYPASILEEDLETGLLVSDKLDELELCKCSILEILGVGRTTGRDLRSQILVEGDWGDFLMKITTGHLCSSSEEIFNLCKYIRHGFSFINP